MELGWQVALPHPHPGPLPAGEGVAGPPPTAGVAGEPRDAGLLGRETKGEVVLVPRLRAAMERLNSALPPEAIAAAAVPGVLCERLPACRRKYRVSNAFLFEWKTPP
jgi:hypothetical protein